MTSQLFKIGQLANDADVSIRTVDFYTQLGLISPAERSAGGFRLYAPETVERIKAIQTLESNGVTLNDIAAALNGETAEATLSETLEKLHRDLGNLDELATSASDEIHTMLTLLAMRANGLVSVAIDLLT